MIRVVESCKLMGLKVRRYLSDVLPHLAAARPAREGHPGPENEGRRGFSVAGNRIRHDRAGTEPRAFLSLHFANFRTRVLVCLGIPDLHIPIIMPRKSPKNQEIQPQEITESMIPASLPVRIISAALRIIFKFIFRGTVDYY
jgi:hypothetical protein